MSSSSSSSAAAATADLEHDNHHSQRTTGRPIRSILKTTRSIDETVTNNESNQSTGMTRSESKSQKIPHFDEINLITIHPSAEKTSKIDDNPSLMNPVELLSPDETSSEHQKSDFNEFQPVRLRRKEIEAELQALEEEDSKVVS